MNPCALLRPAAARVDIPAKWKRTHEPGSTVEPRSFPTDFLLSARRDAMGAVGPAPRRQRDSPASAWRDAGPGVAPVGRNHSVLACADESSPSRPGDLRTRGPRWSIAD